MKFRKVASLEVSVIGLGCWNFGRYLDFDGTKSVVMAALDAGINFFDTADRYGKGQSEEFLGRLLSASRSEVVIGTKFGAGRGRGHRSADGRRQNFGGGDPAYIVECVHGSLRRLKTDYIDLLQMHEPDQQTPIEETLESLNRLQREGKVREIGGSNFVDPQSLINAQSLAVRHGLRPFASVQNQYSLLHRQPEDGLIEAVVELGLAFLPYFPLACGMLTGKYTATPLIEQETRLGRFLKEGREEKLQRFYNPRNLRLVQSLTRYAETRGRTITDLALAWLLAQPGVAAVIPGATSASQVAENVKAVSWQLDIEELAAVGDILVEASTEARNEPDAAETQSPGEIA